MSTNLTRRNALKTVGSASAIVATATVPAIANSKVDPHPAWMDRVIKLRDLINAGADDDEIWGEKEGLLNQIYNTPVRTIEGVNAKIRAIEYDLDASSEEYLIAALEEVRGSLASIGGAS